MFSKFHTTQYLITRRPLFLPTFMARKKAESTEKKKKTTKSKTKAKTKKTKGKTKSSKKAKKSTQALDDAAIVIVDDNLEIDKEKEIEERRAYLEEARSQEAFD